MRKLKDILEKKAKDNRKRYEEIVTKKNNWLNGPSVRSSLDTSKISKQQNSSSIMSPSKHYKAAPHNNSTLQPSLR
jgi:hypothetical protein